MALSIDPATDRVDDSMSSMHIVLADKWMTRHAERITPAFGENRHTEGNKRTAEDR